MFRKKFYQHYLQKITKPDPSYYKLYFTGLVAFGVILVLSGFTYLGYRFYEKTVLSFSTALAAEQDTEKPNKPVNIAFPDRNINVSVTTSKITNGVWEVADANASIPQGSKYPGEQGNIIVYGHNKASILGNLKRVQIGDKIVLTAKDNQIYIYQVEEIKRVSPGDVSVVAPSDTEVLTVYTCIGFLDSERLVIKALPFKV